MVKEQHPITPPPELVRQWIYDAVGPNYEQCIATAAVQWGADQELEACCEWVRSMFSGHPTWADELRAARHPKPPSLKEQALGAMGRFTVNAHTNADEMNRDFDTIRRALEQLND